MLRSWLAVYTTAVRFVTHNSRLGRIGMRREILLKRLRESSAAAFEEAPPAFDKNVAFAKCDDSSPLTDAIEPYKPAPPQCVLCKYQVNVDYKNPRLLSQFISSFTGRLYEKHITGLCEYQQSVVRETIALSRKAGYMPVFLKDPKFLKDPVLFDPMSPQRANPF